MLESEGRICIEAELESCKRSGVLKVRYYLKRAPFSIPQIRVPTREEDAYEESVKTSDRTGEEDGAINLTEGCGIRRSFTPKVS